MSQAEKGLPSYVEPTFSRWKDETVRSWVRYAMGITGMLKYDRVRVAWAGNMRRTGTDTMARARRISNHMIKGNTIARSLVIDNDLDLWKKFAVTCYLPYYMAGRYWAHSDAKNYRLVNFATIAKRDGLGRQYITYGSKGHSHADKFKPLVIMTAFNTALGKRLIVDGVHRCSALVNHVKVFDKFPNMHGIRVFELAGPMLHLYFPYDFASMIVEELLNIKPPMEL